MWAYASAPPMFCAHHYLKMEYKPKREVLLYLLIYIFPLYSCLSNEKSTTHLLLLVA